jgi:vancomycin resistance protein YoaR
MIIIIEGINMLLDFFIRNKLKIIITAIIMLLIALLLVTGAMIVLNRSTFYNGVSVEGIDISGLSKSEAKQIVGDKLREIIVQNRVVLKHEYKIWETPLRDISYVFLVDSAIEKAYSIGRSGNVMERLRTIADLYEEGINIDVRPDFSKEELLKVIEGIKKEVDRKEIDASVIYKDGNITFNKEVIGQFTDVDKNMIMIENRLLERDFSFIELDIQKILPRVLYNDICDVKDIVASFSTSFNANKTDRSYNVKLACERINNSILLSKDVFSMDKALGSRTAENGYKQAPVIVNGLLIEGIGGGVCQVTTTLYIAVLKAKLNIDERRSHSMRLSYVEPGQDATIAEGYIDFKFSNNKPYAILINAEVIGNKIVIRLLSRKDIFNYDVRLKSVITEEIPSGEEVVVDSSLTPGERVVEKAAVNGVKTAVYRETYDKSGKLIEREKISEDIYKPVKGRVRINPSYNDFAEDSFD